MEDVYRIVIFVLPDWLMIIVTGLSVASLYIRYNKLHNKSLLSILVPLTAFLLFYIWSTFLSPDSLARLAVGRIVSFCLIAGIIGWAFLKRH